MNELGGELELVRDMLETSQKRIQLLVDELNRLQRENANLRAILFGTGSEHVQGNVVVSGRK
jgi:hypothetical protein